VVEIELTVQNPAYPFVGVSEEEQCRVELAKIIPRPEGKYAEFFNVLGAPPARITSHVDTYDTVETSLLSEYDDGGLFEFIVSGNCPAYRLAELGALPKTSKASTVVGVSSPRSRRGMIRQQLPDSSLRSISDFELIAKRTKDTHTSMLTPSTLQQSILNDLTNRQQEVLQTAFGMGYYEWPRDCTGQDVADELGSHRLPSQNTSLQPSARSSHSCLETPPRRT